MELKTETVDGGVRLELSGELDLSGTPVLEATLRRLEESQPSLLVLDLSKLTFIDSSGLRAVLLAHQRAKGDGRRLAVVRVPERIRRIFRITGIDTVLDFTEPDPAV